MANIVLSSKNAIDSTVSFYGSADASYPLTNLRDSNFSKVWRWSPGTNADGNTAKILFSLATPVRCRAVTFCRHNLNEAAQIRLRAGMARLDVDLIADNTYSPAITYGGGNNGTRTNEYGAMVAGTCPRYEHDRRYPDNGFLHAEDLSQPAWTTVMARKVGTSTVEFPKAAAAGGAGSELEQALAVGFLYNDTYELKAQVRLLDGNGDFCFQVWQGNAYQQSATVTATIDGWAWVTATITVTGAISGNLHYGYVHKLTAAGVLQIRKVQIRRGASNGKYRKTTSQRRYQRLGVITEAGATNSLIHSSELDNAAWTKAAGITITPNSTVAPDGTTTMDTVTAANIGDSIYQSISLGGTTVRAASFVFKAGGTSTSASLDIQWASGGTTQTVRVNFNPSAGAFISTSSSGATLRAGDVDDWGNGYYRAYVIGVGTDAANTLNYTQVTFQATGTLIAWGFQNESDRVTTHIQTTTAAVTRTVDTAVVEPVTWVPYVWNAVEGTIYHEAMIDEIKSGILANASRIEAYSAGTNIVRSDIFDNNTSVLLEADVFNGGSITAQLSASGFSRGVALRSAIRYRANDVAASFNGAAVVSDLSTAIPAVTTIDLMSAPSVTSYLRRVTIWPTGKSNADLQSLATSGPSAIDYDGGWDDVLQMSMAGDVPTLWGHDYDVIKTFSERAVEWVRVEIYDPAKTGSSTPFEIGRAFIGKLTLQPAANAEAGLGNGWIERTTFTESEDGRKFFNERSRIREVAFTLPQLTRAEGAKLHEMQGSGGTSEETLFLPDPDDEAECQRYGFVGLLKQLDPLRFPLFDVSETAFQIAKKR